METLKFIYQQDKRFFRVLLWWFVLVFALSVSVSKGESFRWINSAHHPVADYFFYLMTHLGDGLLVVLVSLMMVFFKRWRKIGLAMLITYSISGLICAYLKRVFSNPRPASLLFEDPAFHTISWMPTAFLNSFPSGHTTSIFAAATTLALFGQNRHFSLIAITIACVTAYSRVYLAQHFVEDLWLGTLIGSATAVICYSTYRAFVIRRIRWARVTVPTFKI